MLDMAKIKTSKCQKTPKTVGFQRDFINITNVSAYLFP